MHQTFVTHPSLFFKCNIYLILSALLYSSFLAVSILSYKVIAGLVSTLLFIYLWRVARQMIVNHQPKIIHLLTNTTLTVQYPNDAVTGKIIRYVHWANILLIFHLQEANSKKRVICLFADALSIEDFSKLSAWCHNHHIV